VSKKFSEWYQKTNKTEDTNKLALLAFKIMAILHNTLLATFILLLETVGKGLFRNLSQNRCNTFLDCRHVCKTCAFYDALQAGKQKEVHPPYSIDCYFVSGSGHSDITRFHPWPPIETGNLLDRAKRKIPKVTQTIGTVDVFDPRSGISGPTSRRASACPNLHE
jgi:hypothetical protein